MGQDAVDGVDGAHHPDTEGGEEHLQYLVRALHALYRVIPMTTLCCGYHQVCC